MTWLVSSSWQSSPKTKHAARNTVWLSAWCLLMIKAIFLPSNSDTQFLLPILVQFYRTQRESRQKLCIQLSVNYLHFHLRITWWFKSISTTRKVSLKLVGLGAPYKEGRPNWSSKTEISKWWRCWYIWFDLSVINPCCPWLVLPLPSHILFKTQQWKQHPYLQVLGSH